MRERGREREKGQEREGEREKERETERERERQKNKRAGEWLERAKQREQESERGRDSVAAGSDVGCAVSLDAHTHTRANVRCDACLGETCELCLYMYIHRRVTCMFICTYIDE